MAERLNMRTTLVIGGVPVDIGLVKTSGKPPEAKHETRRMIGDRPAEEVLAERAEKLRQMADGADEEFDAPDREVLDWPALAESSGRRVTEAPAPIGADPLSDDATVALDAEPGAFKRLLDKTEPDEPVDEERVEQGVYAGTDIEPDGPPEETWIDLTDRLAEIDERTKITDAAGNPVMEVEAVIPSVAVPRVRVRDAHYVCLAGQDGAKVLELLWEGLRDGKAAVVRWTKRTNQAAGIIVAQARPTRCLVLLEVEWAENMVAVPQRAQLGKVETTVREQAAIDALLQSMATSPDVLDGLRDERLAKRAELLMAAREGRLDEFEAPPAREPLPEGDVVALFERAAETAGAS